MAKHSPNGPEQEKPRSHSRGAASQRPRQEKSRPAAQDEARDETRGKAPAGEPENPAAKAPKEPKEVVIPGRATKRRAFFERHTGPVAQVLALVAVLFGACMLLFNYCNKQPEEEPESSSVWEPQVIPPPAMPEEEPEPEPEEPEPEPEPEQLAFTEEQQRGLAEMLETWAAEPTFVDKREKDEAGNPIGEERLEESGGHDVAVWFWDVESGAEYGYNTEHKFIYASLMKAPYACYLYQLADAGECDLNELLAVGPQHLQGYEDNTGILKSMELPQDYSVETLIAFMLQHSDTVALRALLQKYPADGFKEWAGEHGVEEPDDLRTILSGNITVREMGTLGQEIYRYIESGGNGDRLRQNMGSGESYRLITSEHPLVHKYGWDEHAYHDLAVVYAPHPYVLVIMTDKWGGSGEERQTFTNITRRLEEEMAAVRAAQGE